MNNDYLVTLEGHNVFREIELTQNDKLVRVGTGTHCDVRFRKDQFFAPFEIEFRREEDGGWSASCSEEVYFGADGVGKAVFKRLEHGNSFSVRYADSGAMLFAVNFAIDFERNQGRYDRYIDLSTCNSLTIGGRQDCNLCLRGSYVTGDRIALQRTGTGFELIEYESRYGVLLDGRRMTGRAELEDKTFFSLANYSFYYAGGKLFFSRLSDITMNGVAYFDDASSTAAGDYPCFNRNTRMKVVVDDEAIPVLDPPAVPQKPKSNIVVQLLPAIGMLAVIVLLRGTMTDAGNSAFIWISVASMGVGILASILGIVTERRNYKKEVAERDEKYRAYIDQKREDVVKARAEELQVLGTRYVSPQVESALVVGFSSHLFDRRVEDDDFLHVMLGAGSRESARQLDYKRKEALDIDELAELPSDLHDEFERIDAAPIVADFAKSNAVGVVGKRDVCDAFVRNVIIDIATRHYESDVKLFAMVDEQNLGSIAWARLLPHMRNDTLNCWNIVCDEESRNVLFEYLYKELNARAAAKGTPLPRFVVFVLDDCGLKNHPISQFVDNASSLGVTFVFCESAADLLPMGCDSVVSLALDGRTGCITSSADAKSTSYFAYEPLGIGQAAALANRLAPVYCEEISLEGSLTKSISLFELLGIISADDLDLASRWASTSVDKSLSVPIGVSKSKVIDLDLHDKAHGPHGLVAGTTGSGKSEILQTYILSIATFFHPYEVSFLIIDFKGGGMVNQFRDLPHLAGAITNIDGREINRSLKSIKAELQKRQRYFAEADVNHISNYIRKYKAGEVSEPLPHLVIIVDEFAELKAEQPEFMKELVSASRIGRSLGVHLILATQKPSGQVSEQIWSNSRFKLCLKVQSKEDSNEVIKSPLAAEIKEPGRAYLQVGNNEIFELFQSGFSGAPERENEDNTREFTIYEVNKFGKRIPVYERKRKKSEGVSTTQLDAIVSHVARYCDQQGIEKLPSICLPSLPDVIPCPGEVVWRDGAIALGVYDDPDNQYQGEACFDIDSTNTLILGSSQTGKTNLLQTIIRAVAQKKSPAQAAFYIMDFASMVLKNFEDLGHVGGVVLPGEDEKVKNLFKLLATELNQRKKRMLEVGVSSFTAYLEAGYSDMPHVYVVIDNFAVFKELYGDAYEDEFISICRDGIAYGVSVIVANSVTSGMGYRHLANFSTRIALTCNDSGEYSTLFDRCRMEPKNVPGRALCSFDKEIYEFQSYLAFQGEREIDRVKAIGTFVEGCNKRYGGARVRVIPSVPDELTFAYIEQNYPLSSDEMAIALSYATVEPVRLDLRSQFSVAVVSKDAASRLDVVRAILAEIHERVFDRSVEVFILDGIMRELKEYERMPYVRLYSGDAAESTTVLEEVSSRLGERYRLVADEGLAAIEDEPYLIVIVNSAEAIDYISESNDLMALYNEMAKQYASMRVLFVFGAVEDASVSYSSPALLKAIKEERRAFVVTNAADQKMFEMPSALARALRAPLDTDQAFYFDGSDVQKVKIVSTGASE